MRVFVSYRHTGADADSTKAMLAAVREALTKKDIAISNVFFDVRKGEFEKFTMSPVGLMREAFKMIDKADLMLALQMSDERSEGMLMEVGYGLARKLPLVVATHVGVSNTYLPAMGDLSVRWENETDLGDNLAEIDFAGLIHE